MIRISSGEYCDLCCIEITSIPDVTILMEENNTSNDVSFYIEKIKRGFSSTLSEIYQIFKDDYSQDSLYQDNSYEMVWYSEETQNQTYKARIRFFIIIRAISCDCNSVSSKLANIKNIFVSSLLSLKYAVKTVECTQLPFFVEIDDCFKKAIVKEDKVGNLQSYVMNNCYIYDKIPTANQDFSMIIDYLSNHPGSLLSIQLLPTFYTIQEKNFIERNVNALDTINKGIHDFSVGNLTNSVAERYEAKYKYYERYKDAALFSFNIIVASKFNNVNELTAKLCGVIDSSINNDEDRISLRIISPENNISFKDNYDSLPWIINEMIFDQLYDDYPIYYNEQFDFRRLSNIVTADEISEVFRLPIGSKYTTRGLKIEYTSKDSKEYHKKIVNAGDIMVGKLKSSSNDDNIGFSLKDLNRHMLIVGVPGMGKTTYSVGLLDTLWKQHKIPFLVIEPAKTEYRAMLKSIPEMQVFTFGKDDISPMPINPFVPPQNVKVKQYKSVLKTAFSAGVSMAESLSKLFEETIDEVYSDYGWLDSDTCDEGGEIFNIQDFAKCFKKTFERHGYVGEAKNVGTAGLLRLVSMTNLFGNYYNVPISDLLSKPTIIELAAVQNKEEKSFIMALLLLNISAYIDNNYLGDGTLRNIVLIEEAHNLLATSDGNGEGSAQPNAIAQELVKNMLAEKRAQGLGIVIADQSPEKVSADVIKLTNIKLGFNLVEKNDKDIFANSTNMDEKQEERMTQLVEGEAFLFMGGMSKPEEIAIPDYRKNHNIAVTITDGELKNNSKYWIGREENLKPYPECKCNCFCGKACPLQEKELAKNVARRLFNMYFNEKSNDISELNKLFHNLVSESKNILNGRTELTKRLFYCIKIHLLRMVKYGTQIKITNEYVKSVLDKAKKQKEGNVNG